MSTATTPIETEKRSTEPSRSKLVPALRFTEFVGEWDNIQLKKICSFFSGGTPTSSNKEYYNGDIPFIGSGNIFDSNVTNYITEEALNSSSAKIVEVGDLLYALYGANSGEVGISKMTGAVNQAILCIRTESEKIEFIHCLLVLNKDRIVTKYLQGGQGNLSANIVKKLKYHFPSLPEQQKIASFLSAVDEKIQQLTKKKELLEQYKKGVMQQLFSGEIRFRDGTGSDYPDWEWVGGNELFDNISDKKHSSDLPILAITQDQGAIPRDLINYKMIVTEQSVASYKVVQIGDFVISLRTFQGGIEFSDYHGICSPAYNILRPSSEDVDSGFYKLYLKTSFYIKQLQKNLEGIRDGKMISYKYFSEIKLPFPSLPEQQKIATYMSSIDTKIESVNNQITQTQTLKKGLLQQMFV
jgi:type I restriction enzyme S subunit